MTKEEINQLGHAFFDGKTIQYNALNNKRWEDWDRSYCPAFGSDVVWRIKPEEPKTITICTFMHIMGDVRRYVKDSYAFISMSKNQQWTHIKSLDQVVEVE